MSEWHPQMPEGYRNAVVTGDARLLAERIPDESVDLIFTDPVYERIDDYRWLAETAARVLKPDSACLAWCGIGYLDRTIDALRNGGLRYRWTLGTYIPGATARISPYLGGFPKWQCCLWFDKGYSFPLRVVIDMLEDSTQEVAFHVWKKGIAHYQRRLVSFSRPDAVVYDPFTGGGTVPAVCKMLGRNYVASEIDPDTAEKARERVLMTQPPLFVPGPEQMVMEGVA